MKKRDGRDWRPWTHLEIIVINRSVVTLTELQQFSVALEVIAHQRCYVIALYSVFQKSDAKIESIITATNLIRIKYPLSSCNYHLSGANVANFNNLHRTVFEQQLFKKWSSKTEVSNMEKSPYQIVRNTTNYSLCSKWSPFAQTFACLLCRPYVLCC